MILFCLIASAFWQNEVKYLLPTPIPIEYDSVNVGEHIAAAEQLVRSNKPLFLHFFNPQCPCSRFNIPHFVRLQKKYGDKVDFVMVVMNKKGNEDNKQILAKYDLNIPIFNDQKIANACGVYSTPQAVILDQHRNLYYRGNYNKSRYCTDEKSNYAQMALDSLLQHTSNPTFASEALTAYGCSLPTCTK